MNIYAKIALTFNVRFKISHFVMIIYPVNDKIWKPGIFPRSLKEFIEELKAFLTKVIAKHFERHQSRIVEERLSKESKTIVLNIVVGHVQMDERFVL